MPEAPAGIVTFLFTDIQGSTRLWERMPEAMAIALARHDALMRHAIEANGGWVFKTIGDAFCAAFASAPEGLRAAVDAQLALCAEPWGETGPLRVRMALHTGAVESRQGDYFGPTVNRVARLLSAGHGGQILLSRGTEELLRDALSEGVSLRPLGSYRLKDLQRPEQIFQLLGQSLPADFPPLRSLEAFSHNLPIQLTSFVGREKEMDKVKELLSTTRLLTLTGSGGCGKTRLALQVAADLVEDYQDGVWLVELEALADPELVPQAVASALGVREEPGRSLAETLADQLKARRLLLLLDNCEHLVGECAQLAEALLRACPKVRILATSREALGVPGETAWRVPSLSLPDLRRLPPPEGVAEFEAVRLFVDRARLGQPGFGLTGASARAVAQLCHRLDGIPLAIELAAARVKVLSAEQIAARLDDRFRLLTGGSRTSLPRQQTLRAAIDWSYDLLPPAEQGLLRRLSVFTGGFALEDAEIVCAGEGVQEYEVLELLSRLVDRSLVVVEEAGGEAGYRLLETVRQYGRDKLQGAGETSIWRQRHRDRYLDLACEAEQGLAGPNQGQWLTRLEREHDNLRASLDWCKTPEEAVAGLRLAGALWRFWEIRGYLSEGRRWLEDLLALFDAAKAESGSATGDLDSRMLTLAKALHATGVLAEHQGEYERAVALVQQSLELYRQLGHQQGVATSLNTLGNAALSQGNYDGAKAFHEEGLALRREMGDKRGIAVSLNNLGITARNQGDHGTAVARYEESLALWRELEYKRGIAAVLNNLGHVVQDQGDFGRTEALFKEALALQGELADKLGVAECLEGVATLASMQGDAERAARLLGATEGLRDAIGAPLAPADRADHDRCVVAVRAELGEEAFGAAWTSGRAMSMEESIAYALEDHALG